MSALSEKDANAQISPNQSQQSLDEALKQDPVATNKHLLKKSSSASSTSGAYISPSDAIMSPASQKLATFKQKQITKQNDPARRSLFARELSSNSDKSENKSLADWK